MTPPSSATVTKVPPIQPARRGGSLFAILGARDTGLAVVLLPEWLAGGLDCARRPAGNEERGAAVIVTWEGGSIGASDGGLTRPSKLSRLGWVPKSST